MSDRIAIVIHGRIAGDPAGRRGHPGRPGAAPPKHLHQPSPSVAADTLKVLPHEALHARPIRRRRSSRCCSSSSSSRVDAPRTSWPPTTSRTSRCRPPSLSIVAIGSTVVILTGGIDLSPGSVIALLTMVLASLLKLAGLEPLDRDPGRAALSARCSARSTASSSPTCASPSFIATLAALSAFRGLALMFGSGTPDLLAVPELESHLLRRQILGIPLPLVYVVVLYAVAVRDPEPHHVRAGDLRDRRQRGGGPAVRASGSSGSGCCAFVIAGACAGASARCCWRPG